MEFYRIEDGICAKRQEGGIRRIQATISLGSFKEADAKTLEQT